MGITTQNLGHLRVLAIEDVEKLADVHFDPDVVIAFMRIDPERLS